MNASAARKQEAVIFLETYIHHHGISPSYDEIGVALRLKSKHGVTNLLDALVRDRLIKRGRKARSIELLPSEYHHAADCVCGACAGHRYFAALKLVHALEVAPPVALAGKLRGLIPLTGLTCASWRVGFPYSDHKRAKPRAKAIP